MRGEACPEIFGGRHPIGQKPHDVHSAVGAPDFDLPERRLQAGNQALELRRTGFADSAQVPLVSALTDEAFENGLFKPGMPVIVHRLHPACHADELRRDDQIAGPDAGAQRFRKRADIDDALAVVGAGEGEGRRAVEIIIAVIVVFDDIGAGAIGPVQQVPSALRRQRRPGRKLMRRGDISKAHSLSRQHLRHQAIMVDRDRMEARAIAFKRARRAAITRVLDDHAGAVGDEDARGRG